MSKPSRRLNREAQKAMQQEVKRKQRELRKIKNENGESIIPRTAANNAKFKASSVTEERSYRKDLVAAQIKTWRAILPNLLKKITKIKDPRKPGAIKYTMNVLILYGILAAIFKFSSRREANQKMTRPELMKTLRQIFPDLDEIPHADTLGRVLANIEPSELEAVCISLISDLIKKKKFRKFLINNCIPISIDGTQKLVRNQFFNEHCSERTINTISGKKKQQYVYVVEANITLYNGLTIPVASEFLYYDLDLSEEDKQDCELKACKRLADRLKEYFPRTKLMIILDGLYPSKPIITKMLKYKWNFMIYLRKNLKTNINEALDKNKETAGSIPGQSVFRERQQKFYFASNLFFDKDEVLIVHAVACHEKWESVDPETGKVIINYSEHRWISNVKIDINNAHELCNLGARKRGLIEDSMNTEKNRGYYYEHAMSTNWAALQCYHLIMRLGHAINAISEFTRKLKKHIKENGVKVILDLILETLSNPWLTTKWLKQEMKNPASILF